MAYYLSGDTHYSHANIMRYAHRPFASVEEMNERLIFNVNQVVKPDDIYIHVGDWSFSRDRRDAARDAAELRAKINCNMVVVVVGNHDPRYKDGTPRKEFAQVFDGCYNTLQINVPGFDIEGRQRMIFLSHYAHRVWDKSHYGSWHCYGHSHGSLPDDPNACSMDVGVDAVAFRASGALLEDFVAGRASLKPEDYRPISIDEVAEFMGKKKFKPIDHHEGDSA